MKRGPIGEYVLVSTLGDEPVRAFVPSPLPPVPPIKIDNPLRDLLDRALISLGRLDSVSTLLPDTHLFFELEEAPGVPIDDVRECPIMWRP